MKFSVIFRIVVCVVALYTTSCSPKKEAQTETPQIDTMKFVTKAPFGKLPDGREVSKYTLTNRNGIELAVINYGGVVVSLKAPDKNGTVADVVLGYDSLSSYVAGSPFFGALIGRYGNRIAKGKFSIDGTQYTLPVNNGENHLHGGPQGFDKVFWNIEEVSSTDGASVKLTYRSVDGEQGYPGNLDAEVIYTLTDNNEWMIKYSATSDKKTVVNLTQHTYFNLTGDVNNDILGHQLTIQADKFLPVDKGLIPTGELKPVANTPFDFTKAATVGSRIENKDEQLTLGKGYDHCWVLNGASDNLRVVASLYDSTSGRMLEVSTTEPGLQFYSGNFLDGKNITKGGVPANFRHGLCLETEHFPDSPNKPSFPSVLLEPGKTYTTTTVYKFSAK
jgi:aldose 1-epimerase